MLTNCTLKLLSEELSVGYYWSSYLQPHLAAKANTFLSKLDTANSCRQVATSDELVERAKSKLTL